MVTFFKTAMALVISSCTMSANDKITKIVLKKRRREQPNRCEEMTSTLRYFIARNMALFMNFNIKQAIQGILNFLTFQVDPSTTEAFFGNIVALYSFGQCVAAPAFGYWSNRVKQVVISTLIHFHTSNNSEPHIGKITQTTLRAHLTVSQVHRRGSTESNLSVVYEEITKTID